MGKVNNDPDRWVESAENIGLSCKVMGYNDCVVITYNHPDHNKPVKLGVSWDYYGDVSDSVTIVTAHEAMNMFRGEADE